MKNRFLVLSGEISNDIALNAEKYGYKVLKTVKVAELSDEVAYHPDLQMLCDGKNVYLPANCYDYYSKLFLENNIEKTIVRLNEKVFSPYPNDCLLNVTILGNNLFKGKKTPMLSCFSDYEIIEVNQGYVNCSTLKISESAIITEDKTIADAALKRNTDVLFLPEKKVYLKGANCGFIGGAAFEDNGKVFFFGNLEKYKYADEITDFCKKHRKDVSSLSNEKLTDYGKSIVIF